MGLMTKRESAFWTRIPTYERRKNKSGDHHGHAVPSPVSAPSWEEVLLALAVIIILLIDPHPPAECISPDSVKATRPSTSFAAVDLDLNHPCRTIQPVGARNAIRKLWCHQPPHQPARPLSKTLVKEPYRDGYCHSSCAQLSSSPVNVARGASTKTCRSWKVYTYVTSPPMAPSRPKMLRRKERTDGCRAA